MSDPVYVTNAAYVYFTCNRDPTSSEPVVVDTGVTGVSWPVVWWNTVTGNMFVYKSTDGNGNLIWRQEVDSVNISSLVPNNAWSITLPTVPFNTSRTPSTTNNATVIASFSQSSTVLLAAIVNAQLSINNVWTTIGTASLSGLLTTQTNSITFDVPKGTAYRFLSSSGTNSVSLVVETIK